MITTSSIMTSSRPCACLSGIVEAEQAGYSRGNRVAHRTAARHARDRSAMSKETKLHDLVEKGAVLFPAADVDLHPQSPRFFRQGSYRAKTFVR